MKTIKYIALGVILISLVLSSFSFYPSKRIPVQTETVTFSETYTQQDVFSLLNKDDQFFTWVHMEDTYPESSRIGSCKEADFKNLWNYIQSETFRAKVQEDLIIAAGVGADDLMVPLFAIRKSSSKDAIPQQQDLEEVSVKKDDFGDSYSLHMSFSESGAKKWSSMTRLNKGKDIAILFKGTVLAAPRVQEEIKDGKCMISGKYTESEIKELKAILEN